MNYLLQVQGIGGGKKWIKRVHKEWNILENSLPAGKILLLVVSFSFVSNYIFLFGQ